MAADKSQQALKAEVSQLKSQLSLLEHSQECWEANEVKLLHRQHQLEKDIGHLQADVTNKSEQITELAMEKDKLQAEVSQLKSAFLQPAVSPSGAMLKVVPFELDCKLASTDHKDDIDTGLPKTGSSDCSHVSLQGELSLPTDEDTSCSHPRQTPCVDFTSAIEVNSVQCDQQGSRLVTGTPIHC